MLEPVALETWLRQEEGFVWIDAARRSKEPAERQRAERALQALDASLRRFLAQGKDRGWVRHRGVRYLLLVRQAGNGLSVMTLARSMSLHEVQPQQAQGRRDT